MDEKHGHLGDLKDHERDHMEDINQIIYENANPVFKTRHRKMKKIDFFENLLKNAMKSNIFYNRSSTFVIKNKFYKSTNYNRFKKTYIDKLRQFQRSKSLECQKYNTIQKIEDEEELPEKSYWTLLRMVIVAFSMECLFCLQEALTVPLLLKLKIPEKFYSLVYLLIPLLGFFFQPVIGVMSDRCQSPFGPRRPFIFILSIMSLLGLLFILNGEELGYLFSDCIHLSPGYFQMPIFGIIIACFGVAMLNFASDSSNNSCRAMVIDNCNQEDQESGLNLMSFVSAIGSLTGYVLGAISWDKTFLRFLGNDMHIVSIITTVIVVVCLIITLTSVEEIPLNLNDDEDDDSESETTEIAPFFTRQTSYSANVATNDFIDQQNLNSKIQKFNEILEESDEDEDQPISLGLLYQSVLNMPKELFRLLICHLLGWMAIWSFCLFFTDFVAQSIYGGDPQSDPGSRTFELYDEGVKMGCWGLVCSSVVSAISAIVLEKYLLAIFSTKTLYFWSHLLHAISVGIIFFQSNIFIILPLAAVFGIVLTINLVLPYQMVSQFHLDDEYRNKSTLGTKRGIGIDCALLSSVYFLAQTLVASFTSLLTSTFGNSVICLTSSLLALLACFWICLFVIFPEEEDTNSGDFDNAEKISFTLTI